MITQLGTDTTIFAPESLSNKEIENWNWEYGYLTESQMPRDVSLDTKIKWLEASCKHNIKTLKNCLKYLVKQSKKFEYVGMLFYRMPTCLLPFYTFKWTMWMYKKVIPELEEYLNEVGEYARKHKIRLTFHAPMTVVLNSVKPNVVDNSIYTLKQLTKIYDLMGYNTNKFHDKGIGITTHIGGSEGGVKNYITAIQQLPKEVLNVLQVENDDKIYTVEDCLQTGLPVVLDIHHDWIVKGHYLSNNNLYEKVKKSWKKVRPKIHVSMPNSSLIQWFYNDNKLKCRTREYDVVANLPTINDLVNKVEVNKLRAHGNVFYGKAIKDLILGFSVDCDIMVEMRYCNIATKKLCKSLDKMYKGGKE